MVRRTTICNQARLVYWVVRALLFCFLVLGSASLIGNSLELTPSVSTLSVLGLIPISKVHRERLLVLQQKIKPWFMILGAPFCATFGALVVMAYPAVYYIQHLYPELILPPLLKVVTAATSLPSLILALHWGLGVLIVLLFVLEASSSPQTVPFKAGAILAIGGCLAFSFMVDLHLITTAMILDPTPTAEVDVILMEGLCAHRDYFEIFWFLDDPKYREIMWEYRQAQLKGLELTIEQRALEYAAMQAPYPGVLNMMDAGRAFVTEQERLMELIDSTYHAVSIARDPLRPVVLYIGQWHPIVASVLCLLGLIVVILLYWIIVIGVIVLLATDLTGVALIVILLVFIIVTWGAAAVGLSVLPTTLASLLAKIRLVTTVAPRLQHITDRLIACTEWMKEWAAALPVPAKPPAPKPAGPSIMQLFSRLLSRYRGGR